jgi:hypothetical protein
LNLIVVLKNMKHAPVKWGSFVCAGVCFIAGLCHAALYAPPTDEELVLKSDFIVVGHLEDGSLTRMTNYLDGTRIGEGWIHHEAIMIIDETLKGDLKQKRVRLLILGNFFDVSVGTPAQRERFWEEHLGMSPGKKYPRDFPTNTVEIFDSNSSIPRFIDFPLVEDARTPNLWFLQDVRPEQRRQTDALAVAINLPENLQPIAFKNYFVAYLSNDPEGSVRQVIKKLPAVSERGQEYLDRKELSRVLMIPPGGKRLQNLIPLFLKYPHWTNVRKGIEECGELAGPELMTLYEQTTNQYIRNEIELIWIGVGYEEGSDKVYEEFRKKGRQVIPEKTTMHNKVPENIGTNAPNSQH